jgi:hypothetical protein
MNVMDDGIYIMDDKCDSEFDESNAGNISAVSSLVNQYHLYFLTRAVRMVLTISLAILLTSVFGACGVLNLSSD